MKKTIIAIQGKAKRGKTATIKEFREVLKLKQECHILQEQDLLEGRIEQKDIKRIITIAYKGRQIKIGIESQGDPGSRLVTEQLKDFLDSECDVIICACRTSGDSVNIINRVGDENGYDVIFTSPYISKSNHETLNHHKAEHVLNLVQKIVEM